MLVEPHGRDVEHASSIHMVIWRIAVQCVSKECLQVGWPSILYLSESFRDLFVAIR